MENDYFTFKRSCSNFKEFANAPKIVQEMNLTYSEARERCEQYNKNRSPEEKENGTKLEFSNDSGMANLDFISEAL